jgi:hypothetical protein
MLETTQERRRQSQTEEATGIPVSQFPSGSSEPIGDRAC